MRFAEQGGAVNVVDKGAEKGDTSDQTKHLGNGESARNLETHLRK